ncbi:hypothetical protein Amsp01_079240 [Amycolatopsis sp. NBRC 101858]|uniref:hypothetical protein n=1 Tax=Amycolatopsis sp. NBRC 101858 TaxID=3032200 RepID=UPI0024A378D9|nr:hypothetical protein [Amycolatopsis sp. NBRC 101858]GLY41901.1 hypothetical protein Amsp01_079240 [Amycolatopsis sp. NBRC 101858]
MLGVQADVVHDSFLFGKDAHDIASGDEDLADDGRCRIAVGELGVAGIFLVTAAR